MTALFKKLTGVLCLTALGSSVLYAQAPGDKSDENIIIHKKGNNSEKLTVVIDGDNVTVNGKPLDQYKDSTFEIRRMKRNIRFGAMGPHIPRNPGAPGTIGPDGSNGPGDNAPDGGQRSFGFGGPDGSGGRSGKGGNREFRMQQNPGNKALLGVVTEKDEKGAKITEFSPESPAEKAGLQKDDIITAINDTTVTDGQSLAAAVRKYKPEDKVKVSYLRSGKKATTTAILGKNKPMVMQFDWKGGDDDFNFEMPEAFEFKDFGDMPEMRMFRSGPGRGSFKGRDDRKPKLGIQIRETEDGKGVKVLSVNEDSPAAQAGLAKDDIITSVNGKDVQSADALTDQLRDVKPGESVSVNYLRNNSARKAEVKFPKKLKTADL